MVIVPPGGAIFTAPPPPASPGPVAALPARNVSPCGTKLTPGFPRLLAPGVLPLVIVIAAFMLMSVPGQNKAFASVIVMAPFIFIFCPALNERLPLVIVICESTSGGATVILCPQHTTKFPSVTVIAALMFTAPAACKVSVVGVKPVLVKVTGSWTVILPAAFPVLVVVIVTSVPLIPLRALLRVLEFILDVWAPAVGEKTLPVCVSFDSGRIDIVTSVGSSNHIPGLPLGALALTLMLSTSSQWPDVSIWPPSPLSAPPRAVMLP